MQSTDLIRWTFTEHSSKVEYVLISSAHRPFTNTDYFLSLKQCSTWKLRRAQSHTKKVPW